MKGAYINSIKAMCSIYESGLMCFKALKSEKFILEYYEGIDNFDSINYDFVIFNYHPTVAGWCNTQYISSIKISKIAIITEMLENNKFMFNINHELFNFLLILDPTQKESERIFAFGRPLEKFNYIENNSINNIPTIGSFGFATTGKRWDLIVSQVIEEFEEAHIRFNIPHATYVPNNYELIEKIRNTCESLIPKDSKITFELTNTIMTKNELIKWCSENTINCFYYYRDMYGLSAVTDDAISAQRPILVTDCNTFRHLHKYIPYRPNIGIKQAIIDTLEGVLKMYDDWSSENFTKKFENDILSKIIQDFQQKI